MYISNSLHHLFKFYQASSSPKLNIVPNMASDAFQSRQHYPRNIEEFNQRFPDNAYNTIHTLAETNHRASGSRWNVKHLEACRVLLFQPQSRPPHPQLHHLTVLEPYLERARAQLERAPGVYQSLVAVTPKRLKQCSHQELRAVGNHFGAFYTRLADVTRLPLPEPRTRPARVTQPPDRPGYVSGEGLGLSSPLGTQLSGSSQPSSFSLSESDPVEQSEHMLRVQHETVTAAMASEFISVIVDLCSEQTQPESRIEFTSAPTTYTMESQWLRTVCQDDGSFIRRIKSGLHGVWTSMGHNSAILEAKALYKSWSENEDVAQLSTNVLAQQACEMISSIFQRLDIDDEADNLSRKDRQYVLYRPRDLHMTERLTSISLFLISVHQTILTFLHTTIEKDYLDYLRSDKPADILPFLALTTSA
jgi:hypothetical protein